VYEKLGSPHHLIWQYYECLHRQIRRVPVYEDGTQKQELVLVVFLAVTVVETFINAFFRVLIEEAQFATHRERIIRDLAKRVSLDEKIRRWPKLIFGKPLEPANNDIRAFFDLKDIRNSLMHFVSSHETVELPGPIILRGMADVTAYESLSPRYCRECPAVIRAFAYQVFILRGLETELLPHAFHSWFGEPPSNRPKKPTPVREPA
jgi:hypothetical protein